MKSGRALYNENDPQKAAWLRELIKANVIAPGEVDERSITEIQPDDLRGFTQCHFFAGIGVWSYALRLAGWPDDRPVWTGSCPCPSFSCAGKGRGFDDPRHLWPAWYRLVEVCRPATLFGEQADGAIGYGWLDLVQTDLERASYAVGKAVLGACSVGAPHIRQRLYFGAHAASSRRQDAGEHRGGPSSLSARSEQCGGTVIGSHPEPRRLQQHDAEQRELREPDSRCESGLSPDADTARSVAEAGATRGFWRDCDYWYGRDGKYRPIGKAIHPLIAGAVKSGLLALADGASRYMGLVRFRGGSEVEGVEETEPETAEARVMRLRGYGDAIIPYVAAEFIRASMEAVNVP